MPNFVNRFLQGGNAGTYNAESLPNITGRFNLIQMIGSESAAGSFQVTKTNTDYGSRSSGSGHRDENFTFDASRSSSTYQNNARVQPDNAEVMYIIKY